MPPLSRLAPRAWRLPDPLTTEPAWRYQRSRTGSSWYSMDDIDRSAGGCERVDRGVGERGDADVQHERSLDGRTAVEPHPVGRCSRPRHRAVCTTWRLM